MTKPVNLVLSGGGVNGIAHLGAIITLQKFDYLSDLKRVAGTSAGALMGLAVALRFTTDEYFNLLDSLHFHKLTSANNSYTQQIFRLGRKHGRYSLKVFREIAGKIIKSKTNLDDATFEDFHNLGFLDLHVIAVNMTKRGIPVDFCYEKTAKTVVLETICAAISVHGLFAGVFMEKISAEKYVPTDPNNPKAEMFRDGGAQDNFPYNTFDRLRYLTHYKDTSGDPEQFVKNYETLGLLIVDHHKHGWLTNDEDPSNVYHKFLHEHLEASIKLAIFDQKLTTIKNNRDQDRIISISDCGNDLFDFDLSTETKKKLMDSGINAALDYLVKKKVLEKKPDEPKHRTKHISKL